MRSKFSNKLYLYNEGSHTLHINGCCQHGNNPYYIGYDSEDEALAAAGRELGMCKLCMQKRDEILRAELQK